MTALIMTVLVVIAGWPAPVVADRFLLHSGAEIRGEQVASEPLEAAVPARSGETLVVDTEEGVRLTLAREQLREVIREDPAEQEYLRRAPGAADTVEAQWELGEWCRQHDLEARRERHLRRVLELEPDHVEARHALGYSEVNGQWVVQAGYLRERGYQLYRGRWRLAQEIKLAEEQSKRELAERQWAVRLKRWRAHLGRSGGREFAGQLERLNDPRAVPAILQFLRHEPLRPVKALYLDALIRVGSPGAIEGLVHTSLNDPDLEVFHECVDRLERARPPAAVQIYIKALEDENNVRVNRAGYALGRLGDPQARAPLIAALITQHKVVVAGGGRGAGEAIRSTFQRDGGSSSNPLGGTGLSTGGGGMVFHRTVSNREVLDGLIRLSDGVSFGFDQRAWRNWLAQEQRERAPANLQRR